MPFRGQIASSVQLGLRNSIGDERDGAERIGIGPSSSSEINFVEPGGYFAMDQVDREFQMETDEIDFRFGTENGGVRTSELGTNSVMPRSSSKRSRAAEVHNLSEKRRRFRINEKLKALQKLIPHSNKSDKASMLDEAIEYLKQLQLQVQMLSMRNGEGTYVLDANKS